MALGPRLDLRQSQSLVMTPQLQQAIKLLALSNLEIEAFIENKDVGFVRPGQHAEVKLETFPFTRYGTVAATVSRVSADAVADDQRGAVFPAVLRLDRAFIEVEGQRLALVPGMNLSAEVKTGRRRVIDYLLSPVRRDVGEALRER